MEGLGFKLHQETVLQTLTSDVLKSSEIGGENLNAQQVRSSIARRLGIDIGALKPADRHVEGVVEMMLDATRHCSLRAQRHAENGSCPKSVITFRLVAATGRSSDRWLR